MLRSADKRALPDNRQVLDRAKWSTGINEKKPEKSNAVYMASAAPRLGSSTRQLPASPRPQGRNRRGEGKSGRLCQPGFSLVVGRPRAVSCLLASVDDGRSLTRLPDAFNAGFPLRPTDRRFRFFGHRCRRDYRSRLADSDFFGLHFLHVRMFVVALRNSSAP